MGGVHQFASTEFIQSGSVAQFRNGITATGNDSVHGISVDGSITATFDGLSSLTTPPPTLTLTPTVNGSTITSANVGDVVTITAEGDFDNFCFVKNIDDGVAGEIIVGDLNEEPEDLTNLTFTATTDYIAHDSYNPPLSILTNGTISDLDSDETIVFDVGTSVPFILSIDLSEQKVISKYIIQGASGTAYDAYIFNSFTFEGSNDDFVSDINTLDNQTGINDQPFDSEDINNSTPYRYYRFQITNFISWGIVSEIQLFSKSITTLPSTPSGRWITVEKGDSNGLYKKDFINETYNTADIYEYLVIANKRSTNQTVVEGITITINSAA
tara:strand:+ start:1087 stop:2067 length:981 start_codon:yes stop_codon:yes gene_type:complete